MKKSERILQNVNNNKELQNNFKKCYNLESEEFIMNSERYIKAIKQGRMLCNIDSVSKSGMSRNIKFIECDGSAKRGFRYYNFNALFTVLGFTSVKNDLFRINGCGMDMVFHTNYTIIHNLKTLGFINKKQCEVLAQQTPHCI